MQKTLLYLFILLLFGGGVYYFIFQKEEAAFPESEAGFRIKDTGSIGTIFLSNPSGQNILLARTDTGWILNKKYPVLMSTLNTLMATLYNQEAVYPTPDEAHNRVITQLAGNGIKVELYDRNQNKMRTFYVGTEVHDYQGTSMLLEGAKRSYVVRIGSLVGILNSRYTTDIDNWRDRTIIAAPAEAIRKIELSYPAAPLNSFTLVNDNGKYQVIADPGVVGTQPLNERRVKAYLGYFGNLVCEGFLNGDSEIDSLLSVSPKRCNLSVTTSNGKNYNVGIFWMPMTQRSKNTDTTRNRDVPDGFDVDRYYAVSNIGDTMLIQEFAFGKIFRKAYEFYQADPTVDVVGDKKTAK
ncbi:MAG TPA: DUF4340 domain-containing protein [Flavipsychrobacter sp.]|nr:DUF4340 domain-containing protein [Flavipsychrobacter sp.]